LFAIDESPRDPDGPAQDGAQKSLTIGKEYHSPKKRIPRTRLLDAQRKEIKDRIDQEESEKKKYRSE
jgi:hypothetical protein